MRRTLRARLAWFYGVTLALILAAFSAVVYAVVEAGDVDSPEVEEAEHTGRHLLETLLAALPVAVAVGVGGAIVVTRRALAPLEEVIGTAERLTADALSLRVPTPPGMVDEVARRCTEVESGARNVDTILTNTMLPEVSRQILGRLAERQKLAPIHVSVGEDGAFVYN